MSLTRAKDYIKDLRRRQTNPFLWPDYLTGLPDKAAVLHFLDEIYPKLGTYSIAYLRITNVDPYLVKYGSDRHAEIVQWAAAILKTVADELGRKNFVGALKTHDFVLMAKTERMEPILKKAIPMFSRQIRKFYTEDDRNRGYLVSFRRNRHEIRIGLMGLIYVMTSSAYGIPQSILLPTLDDQCSSLETSGDQALLIGPDHLR